MISFRTPFSALPILVAGLLCVLVGVPAFGASSLYAAMGDSSFVLVDTLSAQLTSIAKLGFAPRALTFDPSAQVMLAITRNFDPELGIIDPQSGASSRVDTLRRADTGALVYSAEAIAYNPTDGQIYCSIGLNGHDTRSEWLATLNPATARVTPLGLFSGTIANDGDALAFVDGVLYMIDDPGTGPSRLYTVNYQSNPGAAALVGVMNTPRWNNVNDLAYEAESQTLYGFDPSARSLITINWLTAVGSLVDTTHTQDQFGGFTMYSISEGPLYTPSQAGGYTAPSSGLVISPSSNPMTGAGVIRLMIPGNEGTTELRAEVFDVTGRSVTTLLRGPMPAGRHELSWSARGDDGRRLPTGIYFVRVVASGAAATARITLVR